MIWRVLFLVLLSFPSPAGDEIGSNKLPENNLFLAYNNLDKFIVYCLDSLDCVQSEEQRSLLNEILRQPPFSYAPGEPPLEDQLKVVDPKEFPSNFFTVEGRRRKMRSFKYSGAPLYFDQERLFERVGNEMRVLRLVDAVRELSFQFAYQLDRSHDVSELEALADVVASILYGNVFKAALGPSRANIQTTNIHFAKENHWDQFILTDGLKMYDLSSEIYEQLICPDYESEPGVLMGLNFYNTHWNFDASFRRPQAQSQLQLHCRYASQGAQYIAWDHLRLKIMFSIEFRPEQFWRFKNEEFFLDIVDTRTSRGGEE